VPPSGVGGRGAPSGQNTSYQHINPGFPASDAADHKKRATEIFPDNSI
jgi:hypothetical protein